jgi:hypothetical protein
MRGSSIAAAIVLVCGAICGRSEVLDSAANGFTVQETSTIQAAPGEVYRRLVHNVGDWWNPAHAFSGDAHNLSIEDKPMGCFCEKLAQGGAVRHMEVVMAMPGKRLVMAGALGPLQTLAAAGSMAFELTSAGAGTKLVVTYAVGGYLAKGLNTWAGPVDAVLAEQVARLKNYVEHGDAAWKAPAEK